MKDVRAAIIELLIALLVALPVTLVLAAGARADGYSIEWYSVNSGGGESTSASFATTSTVGQPVTGFVVASDRLHWIGFWSGEMPVPTALPSVASAKLLVDGELVSVVGKIAVSGATDFDGFFYIEESDRSSGIKVVVPAGVVSGLTVGTVVNVIGRTYTDADGERRITGSMIIIGETGPALAPVGMSNRSMGGGDLGQPPMGQRGVANGIGLNNIGLLIKTWGTVVSSDAQSSSFVVSDGSSVWDPTGCQAIPVSVNVVVPGGVALPETGARVAVTGISSCENVGGELHRLLRVRTQDDILTP